MTFDSYIARQEGWDLFDVDGCLELQRVDDPTSAELHYDEPLFDSDEAALAFVTKLAGIGSYYHQQALTYIGAPTKRWT